jgi:hypothetical protein
MIAGQALGGLLGTLLGAATHDGQPVPITR